MLKRKRKYKVYVRFTQEMPFIVEALNAKVAMEKTLRKARACSVDGETIEVVSWKYLMKEPGSNA